MDQIIVLVLLSCMAIYGIYNFKFNHSSEEYFLGGRNTPWWIAMLSIVATETSVLTFISVPGLAYRSDWFFLQLALGYIVGRILVSLFLLPMYFKNNIISIYEVIGSRFSKSVQKTASGIFLVTRLFADGVRFLATAVVVQVVTGWSLWLAVLIIGFVTMIYTLSGGIRSILWIDSFQFILYLVGGLIVIIFILRSNQFIGWDLLLQERKMEIFRFATDDLLKDSWYFFNAFFGGTLLSFASHGADYMMVQRVLSCKNLSAARKAMIGSGIFVFIQFLVFLLAGSLIWVYMGGIEIDKDRELSSFIVTHLPIGIRGILLAGVLSAAMSTLSSSINSLASSTLHDWFNYRPTLRRSFFASTIWAILLISIALLFDEGNTAIIILGLKIASFTYGGLLSLFILSRSRKQFSSDVLIVSLIFSFLIVFYLEWMSISWTWYIGVAVLLNLFFVYFMSYFKKKIGFFFIVFVLLSSLYASNENYENGVDILVNNNFDKLDKKNIGLIVNHTSIDKEGNHLISSLFLSGKNIIAIFTPEHGFKGVVEAGTEIKNGIEPLTGAPIYSLYGKLKKPSIETLKDIDLLVFDIQDIGVRYYTYISTMTYVMESAAQNHIPVLILDRVNPLGRKITGPILQENFKSFVGMHSIPICHGMSLGEIASMINGEGWLANNIKANIEILEYKGLVDDVIRENAFIPSPSPNMPDLETAWFYQGLCLLEGTNLSEGRGTDSPFKIIGSPWLDAEKIYHEMQKYNTKGDKFRLKTFTPRSNLGSKYPKYIGEKCFGIEILNLNNPLEWTIRLLETIHNLHANEFKFLKSNFIDKLYGSDQLRLTILNNGDINKVFDQFRLDRKEFNEKRKKYLIY